MVTQSAVSTGADGGFKASQDMIRDLTSIAVSLDRLWDEFYQRHVQTASESAAKFGGMVPGHIKQAATQPAATPVYPLP